MNTIIIAIFTVTVIGVICAAMLSIASKVMAVKVDERMVQIQECLPGSNCGACGYPGCSGYAMALISEADVKNNLCTPGGAAVSKQLSEILGGESNDVAVKLAVVRCRGDCGVQQKKMDYKGIQSCMAAKQVFGGEGACAFGCIGYGDCKTVCPSNAVCIENQLARINTTLCTGCGLCVKACPSKLITIENDSIASVVLCKNIEKGAVVRKKCSNGCIGCGKCVRECPSAAIILEENLAKINYEKCTGCGHCAEICVTRCIQLQVKKQGENNI